MKDKKFRNFIIFWVSQSVSQLGSSMTSFALIIWAYKETSSAMAVSLMTFFSYVPYIAVSIFAGAFIDKHRKKTIMLVADSIAAVCSTLVLLLIILGKLQIYHVYIVNTVIGLMNSFQSPAESVAIGIMVPREKYRNASGMDSFTNSLATVVSPMLAAFVSSIFGLVGVILIDLLTFIFAFIVLAVFVKIPETINYEKTHYSVFKGCRDGLDFLVNNKGILYLMISMASLLFFSRLTYENILSPMILARSGGDDKTLGIVTGILGLGGIIGGLIVSFKKLTNNNLKLIYFSAAFSFLFGDVLIGLGQNLFTWCIAAICASVPIPFITAGQRLIMYNLVPREIQGRVFAIRNSIQYCTIPIGLLLGGFLADYVFEPFMKSNHPLAIPFQNIVGNSPGSGMALMFLITGVLGFLTSVFWYRNKNMQFIKN